MSIVKNNNANILDIKNKKSQHTCTKQDNGFIVYKNLYTFFVWMTFINFMSCILLVGYAYFHFNNEYVLIGESVLALLKWNIEYKYGKFTVNDWDLAAHHLFFFAAVGLTLFDTRLYHCRNLLIHGVTIHIPFAFAHAKKITSGTMHTFVEYAYLILWLPFAVNRSTRMLYAGYRFITDDMFWSGGLCIIFGLVFTSLDLVWTPWKKYFYIIRIT